MCKTYPKNYKTKGYHVLIAENLRLEWENKKMIYMYLQGRLGNQLFIYAFAKQLSQELSDNDIVIDDSKAVKTKYKEYKDIKYENLLLNYNLENVRFVHNRLGWFSPKIIKAIPIYCLYRLYKHQLEYRKKYEFEKKWQPFFNRHGLILCENGFINMNLKAGRSYFVDGFYQSDKYFPDVIDEIRETIGKKNDPQLNQYPNIDVIRRRNTVCISIKVDANVGNPIYDVCSNGYWEKAFDYISKNVDDPLFFVCSDRIDYVKKNIIDENKYEVIYQSSGFSADITLAVMGLCKHYIISNTTFAWWAQFLGDYPGKIVVAPSKWFAIDIPTNIIQDTWHLIDV